MFKIGDAVVYGQTGVCIIEDIVEKSLIKNEKREYYLLKPYFQQNNVIYAPVNSEKVNVRPVMARQEAEDFIKRIPQITANTKPAVEKEDYRSELENHNCDDLVELTAKIYLKKKEANSNKKKLGFVDEKYMKIGEELLFGELAFVLEIPINEVQKYIEEQIN